MTLKMTESFRPEADTLVLGLELVGLEQIRELLWPDVQIEFEQSLHFCIRQIRAALGDSATTPRFVETVPRRGYRLIADTGPGRSPAAGARVSAGQADQANPAAGDRREYQEPQPKRPKFSTVARWAIVLLLLPVAGFTLLSFLQSRSPPSLPGSDPTAASPPLVRRVAIMSFEPLDPVSDEPLRNGVAEAVLSLLTAQTTIPLEVVGPTTTFRYESRPDGLPKLIDDYRLDFVVNGRAVERNGVIGVLAEVIRARDGAHVWVQAFHPFPQGEETAVSIANGLLESLTRTVAVPGKTSHR